jgi:hypothetical protein
MKHLNSLTMPVIASCVNTVYQFPDIKKMIALGILQGKGDERAWIKNEKVGKTLCYLIVRHKSICRHFTLKNDVL